MILRYKHVLESRLYSFYTQILCFKFFVAVATELGGQCLRARVVASHFLDRVGVLSAQTARDVHRVAVVHLMQRLGTLVVDSHSRSAIATCVDACVTQLVLHYVHESVFDTCTRNKAYSQAKYSTYGVRVHRIALFTETIAEAYMNH